MRDREQGGDAVGSDFVTAAKSLWQRLRASTVISRHEPDPFGPLDTLRDSLNRAKTVAELDDAIRMGRRLVADTTADHPAFPGSQYHLARALVFRFSQTKTLADLDEAIVLGHRTLAIIPADTPFRADLLAALGSSLRTRFEHTATTTDLDDAIRLTGEAVARTSDGDPNLADRLDNLVGALMIRFGRTHTLADLDEAITLGHRAVAATAPDDPVLGARLMYLAAALADRYAQTRAVTDLDETIELGERALSIIPTTIPDGVRIEAQHVLGMSLRTRFEHTGVPADADEAIRLVRQAMEDTPADDPGRADTMHTLRQSLVNRFGRTGMMSDLDEAVELAHHVVVATPAEHPDRARNLAGLGITLRTHFERTGNPADLDEAIRVGREAVAATTADDPHYPERASSLGRALVDRFDRTGSMTDLDEAIRMARQAVTATSGDGSTRAGRLTTLGIALRNRFERTRKRPDLDEAITSLQDAVDLAPADYRGKTSLLMNLGNALRERFEQTTATTDLEAAIGLFRQAVAVTPTDHPDMAAMLANLGRAVRARFEHTKIPADLDEAIVTLRRAANMTPADHPDHAHRLNALGVVLMMRFWQTNAATDREEAKAAFLDAERLEVAPPPARILAARAAADLVAATQPDRAAELIEHAIRLLPEVAPRQLERSDQQFAIGEWGGFAADAAALTLRNPAVPEDNRADLALRLLEAGRAVLLSQTVQVRADITDLMDQHSDLAGEFVRLRDHLNRSNGTGPLGESDNPDSDRHQLAREFEHILTRIRTKPEFETFALPPSTEQLVAQAVHGPVIVFSISDYRSDALMLTADGISSQPLSALSPQTVRDKARSFRDALHTADNGATGPERQAAQRQLSGILEWLWDNATGPVLDALGYHQPITPGQPGPRVWWAPGGLLGQLPIHAAGYHTRSPRSEAATVMDRVVPSYTPTVAALGYARQRPPTTDPATPPRALIVAMPTTPGVEGRLHHVIDEAHLVATHLPGATLLTEPDDADNDIGAPTTLRAPTTEAVLDLLSDCAFVHFACHGTSDPADPSHSHLLLHDHATTPLTVAALAPIQLDHVQLAYLSACDTASTADARLVDESIHLASAFQLAGYPHVIGTMWTIDDGVASRIADAFYKTLRTATDAPAVDVSRAPYALHHAIRTARDTLPATPSLWAAYLHTGA
ncbi:CHAT domain-containing protein [Nocardia vinacea]|uniref:CHAT domain-containing protein n=1 Tax=Nocardia vinacea TaxID=96468 RepID=UPI0033EE540D